MPNNYLIGVDLGTSVVKATLLHIDGVAVAAAHRAMSIARPAPGLAEQDPEAFEAATYATIREVMERSGVAPGAVAAIAFAGQMGGALGVDIAGEALTPWYPSTLDTRYVPYLTPVMARAGDRVWAIGGAVPLVAPRMAWWKAVHPGVYAHIHKFMILANYVAARLGGVRGEDLFIDPSYLIFAGVADTANRRWSPELMAVWDFPEAKLPRIAAADAVVGKLTPAAASACGLVAGIPLVAGAGDQVAGFLGAGLVENGEMIDVAGTFPVLGTCLDHFVVDATHRMWQTMPDPLGPNHWYPLTYIGGGGLTHRWFLEQFGPLDAGAAGTDLYARWDAAAATVEPGAEGLIFIPHLLGRACPDDPAVRGAWIGFSWTHEPRHFYRAVLESIGYDFAVALGLLREMEPTLPPREVRVIGGGARSGVWNQLKSDILGVPYRRLAVIDRAALGCAIIAGHAVGIYPDMAAVARKFAQPEAGWMPDVAAHERYRGYVKVYDEAFVGLRGVFEGLERER
ncbi:MAG: xylulose kinase [Anaerolineales bacterium]|nr:xylulose kinase [Anaerolineales bacterium]